MINRSDKISWANKEFGYLIVLIIGLVFYNSLFFNKALHIDDPFVIEIARAVNQNFINVPRVFFSNPILMGYYYAPIIRLFGENEIWLHIFYLPFSLLAIISMFILSLRFTGRGLWPTLSLLVSPAFLIMSHSIMLDIPVLAFSLAALAAFIYGIDKNDNRLLFLSGILVGIASLVKYSGLMFIPIMFIYALLFSKRRSLLFLIIPLFIFFIWVIHNEIFYKSLPFMEALIMRVKMWSINTLLIRLVACLSFLTGTSITSLFLIPFLLRNKNNLFLLFLSLLISLCPFSLKGTFNEYSYLEKFFLMLLFTSSVFIIFIIFKTALVASFKNTHKDKLFLSLWFIILLVFTIFMTFIAARFILLLLPPMFLLIYEEVINRKVNFLFGFKKMILFSITITFLISTILAVGDYRFAGAYRDFIGYLKKRFTQNDRIYFCTASYSDYYAWGYSYYIKRYFPNVENDKISDNFGKIQDIFLTVPTQPALPIVIHGICTLKEFDKFNKILINQLDYRSNVFLHNLKYRSGFYSHDWGLLPFKLSLQKATLEKFFIYKLISIRQD